jgi:hypothetical protein
MLIQAAKAKAHEHLESLVHSRKTLEMEREVVEETAKEFAVNALKSYPKVQTEAEVQGAIRDVERAKDKVSR